MSKDRNDYIIRPNPRDPRLTERVAGVDQTGARIETSVTVERALTIFERSLGASHPKVIACRENYAASVGAATQDQ